MLDSFLMTWKWSILLNLSGIIMVSRGSRFRTYWGEWNSLLKSRLYLALALLSQTSQPNSLPIKKSSYIKLFRKNQNKKRNVDIEFIISFFDKYKNSIHIIPSLNPSIIWSIFILRFLYQILYQYFNFGYETLWVNLIFVICTIKVLLRRYYRGG